MQYSTAELRHRALEDVLDGPEKLHAELGTKLAEVREFRASFPDAQVSADPDAFPPVRHSKPPRRGDTSEIPSRPSQLVSAVVGGLRQFRGVRALSREFPESNLPTMDARWYRLATLDSAIVSMPDGTSAAFYRREPEQFRDLLRRTIEIHERLYREWPSLSQRYRDALRDVTSPETWETTFKASTEDQS
jgi:galactofuranosylgalactofuranosylrhamnosyl-N-acetylglucosaminyl-diphospho-decaprenol beta-1,5/1,6-galactofuranosyltransferase